MGCLAIKEILLRCEKCFMLKLFLIKPDYPQTTLICRCSCGLFSVPLLSFTKALQIPLPFKIKCTLCSKEPKHPSYCTGCRKTFCSTCKFKHNTQTKTKTKHNLIDSYKYDFYCAEHQDVFNSAYCDDCHLDICQKCINQKLHTGHIVYLYSQLKLSKKDEKKTKNDIEASAEKIIKKINMSKALMKQINDKEQINYLKEVVNTTMMDNKSIIALIQYFYQIYLRAKHKNYAIIYNLKENLKFNLFPIQLCPSNTLDDKLKEFIEFLKSDFVLFKRIISTKKRQNTLGNSKEKSEKSKKSENEKIINLNNEHENNIIDNNELEDKKDMNTNENNDSMSEDNNEEKDEEINNDTKINEIYSSNNLDTRYNSIDAGFRKRGISIFDINKIIKEKYDDAIFKEDTEEINSKIKPCKMEKISDKELNKITESTDDKNNENKEIIEPNNSKSGHEEKLNQEEIKINNDSNIENKDENKEDNIDMNLNINFEQEKVEQKKEHEKPLNEEKIIDMNDKNDLKEEHQEIDNNDNNKNNKEINAQNEDKNQDINSSNEKDNNEINIQLEEKINVEKETTIEKNNDKVIKDNEEIKKEEEKEEKKEEKIEEKKEEEKEEKKEEKIEEKKEEKIEEKKEEKREESKNIEKKEEKKDEHEIKEKKEEKKEEKKDEHEIKEKKEEKKDEHKTKEKKDEKKEEKKDEHKIIEKKDEKKEEKKDEKKIEKKDEKKIEKKDEKKIKKKDENKIKEKKDEKKIEKKDEKKIEKKDENKIKEKKDEKKEVKKIEKKDENKIKDKKDEKKEEKKIEKKDENKIKEKKDEKKDENKIKGKKEEKKDEKKDDPKTKNLQKNPKVTNNDNQAKKVPQKPKTEIAPKKLSSLQDRMNMFEKKNTTNNNKNEIKTQIVKNSLKSSAILSNPKFSNLAKMMNVKMPHGPGAKRENVNVIEKPKIIEERVDPNTLLMNIPMANNVKKKPKKVNFE